MRVRAHVRHISASRKPGLDVRFASRTMRLTVENPDRLSGLLQCFGHGPEVAAAVDVPLGIIPYSLSGEASISMLRGIVGAVAAIGAKVGMAVFGIYSGQ